MQELLKYLGNALGAALKARRWADGVRRCCAALRALWFARLHRELFGLHIFRLHVAAEDDRDALFHLSHRHYLSTRFKDRQRIECALTHYRYDSTHHDHAYQDAVYRGAGLELWSSEVDGVRHALTLRPTTPRNEGGISVLLLAGDLCLCEMSFVWLDGSMLGTDAGILPFITRNQSIHHQSQTLARFRAAFPQNSPSYFCLAALHGIAAAHGRRRIAGIGHDCQIAYEDRYAQGFRNSYTEFWKAFGGVELGSHAFLMTVPLEHPPLAEVKAKHRKRAHERRRHWADITHSAITVMARHCGAAAPAHAAAPQPRPMADAVQQAA